MDNPITIPLLSSLCGSPSSLSCRLAEMKTIVVLGRDEGRRGHSIAKTEVVKKGQKRSDRWNYDKILSKKWKWIPWQSVQLIRNSVDIRMKYTRQTQDRRKKYICDLIYVHSFLDITCAKVTRILPESVCLPFLELGNYFGAAGAFWDGGVRSNFNA